MSPDETTLAVRPPWVPAPRRRPTWGFAEGDLVAPGRSVLSRLGGGSRFDVYLVWDDTRLAVMVAKLLRPDQAEDASRIPCCCAASTPSWTAGTRTC